MKKSRKFEGLLQEGLQDLYDAEKQLVEGLPKFIAAANSEELSEALQEHLEATREQVSRLETIFEQMAENPGGTECKVMRVLTEDAARAIAEIVKSPVLDAAIIAAAQKVEHYEIAAYQTVSALAEMLGQQEASDLLQESLAEEEEAAETLMDLRDAVFDGDQSREDAEEAEVEEKAGGQGG